MFSKTFQYDTRLNDGSAYLVADYTIQRNDAAHRGYVIYAAICSVIYCFGIPAASSCLLQSKKEAIQEIQMLSAAIDDLENGGDEIRKILLSSAAPAGKNVKQATMKRIIVSELERSPGSSAVSHQQRARQDAELKQSLERLLSAKLEADPLLAGIRPLYQDYEAEYYWFEVPKFASTLVLCGLAALMPTEGASQIFLSLMVSIFMMMMFANCKPYRGATDDALSQFCQLSLTFAMAVGILPKASKSFQVQRCALSYVGCAFIP